MTSAPFDIIATLGPASLHLAAELAQAGAKSFRLNASHMTPSDLARAVRSVRQALPAQRVVVDLQGAKMRLGTFEPRDVKSGQTVRFAIEPADPAVIPLDHPELYDCLQVGDTLSLDDDRVRMRVLDVSAGKLSARCLGDATLRPRKGVNVVEHPVQLADLSARDQAHLRAVAPYNGIDFAFSFMLDGREAAWVRRLAPNATVVGKIERIEAVHQIRAMGDHCDELWICRGDLGAQMGAGPLARFVSTFRPWSGGPPVIMAGQVLEHLTHHADPTRSEVCHLYDLAARGYAGIVLSDETAIGHDPVAAVRIARALLDEAG
jgi:pyruvate kinase